MLCKIETKSKTDTDRYQIEFFRNLKTQKLAEFR